jgi:SAM-dependent methyltransferase
MARLASQARMGYYPTPPVVVNHIKKGISLSVGEATYRLLDTCCGEGEALDLLASGLGPGVGTFGVELDETRVKKSSQRLNQVVWGDALTELRISIKAFSLLWLNPPYDWDSGGGGRLEARFLQAHLKYLAPKGWLIFIIPLVALRSLKDSLSQLRNLQIYAFPQPEYDVFKQVVVLGQKSPTSKSDDQLTMLNELVWLPPPDAWERLLKTTEIPKGSIVLPPSPPGRVVFASERSDMERAAELVARSPLWTEFEVSTTPESLHQVQPLAPLRKGHQATLLASGLMNGEVESNGRHLVIKGSVNKSVDVTTEITDTHKIETLKEKFHIGIRAIDLGTKGIFQIS